MKRTVTVELDIDDREDPGAAKYYQDAPVEDILAEGTVVHDEVVEAYGDSE